MEAKREYFLGLDLGTGSVGWCVTDTKYHILKANRKRTIGSVLFSTADTAKERRIVRCARRRLRRQQERLQCLQELFDKEIRKVDEGFFCRLQESPYVPEDKRKPDGTKPELPYALFTDPNYTDKDFHREYPTIYHLRKELMDNPSAHDVRLVYLAAAHILKHRGHFLSNISTEDGSQSFEELFNQFAQTWNEYTEKTIVLSEEEKRELKEILLDREKLKTEKQKSILQLLRIKDRQIKEMAALLTGASVSLERLFDKEEYKNLEDSKIQFDSSSYEEKEAYYQEVLEDDFEVIKKARAVFNFCALSKILKNNPGGRISDAKTESYEKHKKDLRILKKVLKEKFSQDTKERILKISEKGLANYPAYIGMAIHSGKKTEICERCSKDEFYRFLEKEILKNLDDCEEKAYIEYQIKLGDFLPKQRDTDNSVIPYQLHEKELKLILKNAEGYLPFLKEKDESGFTVSEKIVQLMTFRIPYYVGPLYKQGEGGYAWVVRQSEGKVYPWNFEQKVDIEKTAEEFIQRAVNKCTYLKKETVLPACSLKFEKYKVLNELNNLKIFGKKLSVCQKQQIYEDLFCHHSRITKKKLIQYLKREGMYGKVEPEDIAGIDGDFKASLKTLLAFRQIHFTEAITEKEMEDMIRDITLFGQAPQLLKKRLLTKYPRYEKQIPVIIKTVKCDGWAPFSGKLLEGLVSEDPGTKEPGNILYFLWNTQQNFMEILYDRKYSFLELIAKENGEISEKTDKINYELVDALYVSPAVKRQIWEALKVIKEVQHFMGGAPKRIFVEMAREKQESKRTSDRKSRLMQLYEAVGEEKELLEELKNCSNDQLRRDKLFFYFTQMGRCAYTGERISFSDLPNDNLYDIDHIYPQSLTADDSLSNRVLVKRRVNEDKKDNYPLQTKIQKDMAETWRSWHEKKLISDEKYRRLTRTEELTADELCGFVSRQLVETRQGTKALTELLSRIKEQDTEVVYVKAGNVSRFRQKYDLLKVRDLNDQHHAFDSYLNIVVGNVYHLKFTKDIRKYFDKYGTYRSYSLTKMFEDTVTCQDETAWEKDKTIQTVKEMMADNRVLVSRQTYEEKGALYKIQRLKKGRGQVPVKAEGRMSDIGKYGGYDKAANSYFMLVKAKNKKGKEEVYILPVPLYLKQKIESSEDCARMYFEQEYGLREVTLLRKIKMQTLFVYEGFRMRIAGRSGSQIVFHNANQLCLPSAYHKTVREIGKHMRELQYDKNAVFPDNGRLAEADLDCLYAELCEKLKSTIFHVMLGGYIEKYEAGFQKYQKLSKEKKAEALFQMLKIFQCTPELPDLSLIGGSKTQGAIRISMNITERKSLAIIHQSVTGIYEKIEKIRG